MRIQTLFKHCCAAAAGLAAVLLTAPQAVVGETAAANWPAAAAGGWRDDSGRVFDLASLRGRFAIVTMAYTHCRLVCPMVFERLGQMQQDLDARGRTAEFVVIGFAGVDDDPATWHRYRLARHLTRSNWHFLTANEPDTERFARIFGFEYWRYDEHVMHGFQIFVFGEDGVRRMHIGAEDGPWRDPRS